MEYNYFFKEIIPKGGVKREIHRIALGKKCKVLDARIGHSATIQYKLDSCEDGFKIMRTSRVVGIRELGGGIIITTENTIYHLRRIDT